jgi:hypothetical protein
MLEEYISTFELLASLKEAAQKKQIPEWTETNRQRAINLFSAEYNGEPENTESLVAYMFRLAEKQDKQQIQHTLEDLQNLHQRMVSFAPTAASR